MDQDYAGATLLNNTVYQPTGNAVQIQNSSQNIVLRNNILWAKAGYDISVDSTSEQGFRSDYNDLVITSGAAGLGSDHAE